MIDKDKLLADLRYSSQYNAPCPEWVYRKIKAMEDVPSARQALNKQTEWNNHTVACLLAELFGDTCACNYNDIDEWLPEKCELLDSCPNPVGVACWEQFLKHRAKRRTEWA